jgi:VCBS repeat-containing protein
LGQITPVLFTGAGITEVIGGDATDILVFTVTGGGTHSIPSFSVTNWTPVAANAWEATGDFVLITPGGAGSYILNAAAGLDALQVLQGGLGNDTINGSDNADVLNGGGGQNQLFGGDGNDSLRLVNQASPAQGQPVGIYNPPTTFNGSGSLFDGGLGTDVLTIGGYVQFFCTLQSIEGVQLLAPVFPTSPGVAQQDFATLELDSDKIAMLPANAFFTGIGTVIVNVLDGASFDGSGYVIDGSAIDFEIYGGVGDGVSLIGTATEDLISFGEGEQTAAGGGGEDRFEIGAGNGTITDFTLGEDFIDLSDTGISTAERLGDFVSQGANGAQIGATVGGVQYQITLQGIDATSLSPDNFILGFGGYPVVEFGSDLGDLLFGFQFNDLLNGGDGNDRIYSGGGLDQIDAGDGDDTVVVDGQIAFGGTFAGGIGTDTLLVRPSAQTIFPVFGPLVSFAGSQLNGFETVRFGSTAGQSLQVIVGAWQMAGISTVVGSAGADLFTISANLSPTNTYTIPTLDLVNWGSGDALILAVGSGTADTTLNSIDHAGIYVLAGGSGDDTLNGSAGIEFLRGGAGDDAITSGGGADVVDGGIGTDTALFSGNRADYAVSINLAMELVVGGAVYNNVEVFRFADGKYLWNGTELVPSNRPPVAEADSVDVDEDATALGNVLANDSTGETDPDAPDVLTITEINGSAITGPTVIQGSYGTLTIDADGSHSYVADADLLDAIPAGAVLSESFSYGISDGQGGTAASTLTFNVTSIADLVAISLGNGAAMFAGTGADEIAEGGRGDDLLFGNGGSDRLYGGLGDDVLDGGAGWDLLVGGNGVDRLFGGTGDDVLAGGRGADFLSGGAGADVFEFGQTATERDTISDFELGIDTIHLSDGIAITGMASSGGSTVLTLSSGGSILLAGVTGIADVSMLQTLDLPDWTAGLPLI